jgi:hypothetical protein
VGSSPRWGLRSRGFYTGNAEHTALLNTVSFLPLVLWRADVALRTHLHRPAVEAGALFGMSALAGYPGLVLLNGAFVAMWSLGRVCWPDHGERRNIRKNLGHAVVTVALVAIIGFIVMTPTYGPFFVEAPGYSQRTDALSRELAVENDALHHAALLTITNPALALADIHEYTDISMRSVYLGSLLPCLPAFALLKRPDGGLRWWLLFMALFFLASAMGRTLPVRGWLYDWFPPTRYFRHSALFRCYFLFALTVLGVLGAGTWR